MENINYSSDSEEEISTDDLKIENNSKSDEDDKYEIVALGNDSESDDEEIGNNANKNKSKYQTATDTESKISNKSGLLNADILLATKIDEPNYLTNAKKIKPEDEVK